jgi:hypothetical protein
MMIPVILIIAGVLLLIGCFPVPATQQLQPNLQPRPEAYIGAEPNKPIHLGETRIEDAFIELSRHIQARTEKGLTSLLRRAVDDPFATFNYWSVSDDNRHFAVCYEVRKATWVWPLCFQATADTDIYFLILDVNDDGVVVGERTMKDVNSPFAHATMQRWLTVFDEPARRKLQAAGIFPSDQRIAMLLRLNRATTTRNSEHHP